MARRRGETEGGDGLGAAVERDRAAFGDDALPCLAAVADGALPVAVALLDHAVAAGRCGTGRSRRRSAKRPR